MKAEACCYEAGMVLHLTTAILRMRRSTRRPLPASGCTPGLTNATIDGERKQLFTRRKFEESQLYNEMDAMY